jgi:hypothetical protein
MIDCHSNHILKSRRVKYLCMSTFLLPDYKTERG